MLARKDVHIGQRGERRCLIPSAPCLEGQSIGVEPVGLEHHAVRELGPVAFGPELRELRGTSGPCGHHSNRGRAAVYVDVECAEKVAPRSLHDPSSSGIGAGVEMGAIRSATDHVCKLDEPIRERREDRRSVGCFEGYLVGEHAQGLSGAR